MKHNKSTEQEQQSCLVPNKDFKEIKLNYTNHSAAVIGEGAFTIYFLSSALLMNNSMNTFIVREINNHVSPNTKRFDRTKNSCFLLFLNGISQTRQTDRFPHLPIALSHFGIQALMSWLELKDTCGYVACQQFLIKAVFPHLIVKSCESQWTDTCEKFHTRVASSLQGHQGDRGSVSVYIWSRVAWLNTIYFEKFRPFCLFV